VYFFDPAVLKKLKTTEILELEMQFLVNLWLVIVLIKSSAILWDKICV
jgi:hypothetical protein